MKTDLPREIGECRGPLLFAGRSRGSLERVERRLRVDHDVLAAREVDHDVRAPSTLAGLARVVDALLHSNELEDPFELDLPPASARLRAPQGDRDRARTVREQLELGGEASSVLDPTRLGLVDESPEVAETLMHRQERLLDTLARLRQEGVA